MFIAALFSIAMLWKQSSCPTTEGWIRKCYKYTCSFVLPLKKYENMLFAGKWMKVGIVMLSEVSQAQKVNGHMFSLICEN
jgi:hypothetical protein